VTNQPITGAICRLPVGNDHIITLVESAGDAHHSSSAVCGDGGLRSLQGAQGNNGFGIALNDGGRGNTAL
jgi:hypothetical protein